MIHKYRKFDHNIVVDTNSGAVHLMEQCPFDLLDFEEVRTAEKLPESILHKMERKYFKDEIETAFSELKELQSEDMLFSEDTYSENVINMRKDSPVKALCLHIAHDCNLRCKYCFGDGGSFHGSRVMMSQKVGRAAIDFVVARSKGRRNIEIDFFGGEPLMNFDTVKDIVCYADEQGKLHDKNFRFTITTNGILLDDDILEFINRHMHNVVLSIDGRKEINDSIRGKGVYDQIVPKFQKAAESRNQDNYYVRGTFTAYNLDFSKDVMHLADLGFQQISVEPVIDKAERPWSLKEEHLPQIFEEYDRLADAYLDRIRKKKGFNFFHFMVDLSQGPCVIKRIAGCGAGCEYLAVSPEGDIYPCHQFVGLPEYKMGNVLENTLNQNIKSGFEESNIYCKDKCKDCWAKFYCSGGCHANAYKFNNDINKPHEIECDMFQKRLECAIALYIEKQALQEEQ